MNTRHGYSSPLQENQLVGGTEASSSGFSSQGVQAGGRRRPAAPTATAAAHAAAPADAVVGSSQAGVVSPAASAAALLSSIKRQRTSLLPTLAESPAQTPGSSPALQHLAMWAPAVRTQMPFTSSNCTAAVMAAAALTAAASPSSSCSRGLSHYHLATAAAANAAASTGSSVPVSPEHSITGSGAVWGREYEEPWSRGRTLLALLSCWR